MNKFYINEAKKMVEKRLDDYLVIAAEVVRAQIVKKTPVKTGNLKGGTDKRKAGKLKYQVYNNVEYAYDVEFGTGPHEITPREKKALRFIVNGDVVFAKRVNHPGTKAQPFIRPGYRAAKAILQSRGIL